MLPPEPGSDGNTLVAVLGTSGCYLVNTTEDHDVDGSLGKVHGAFYSTTIACLDKRQPSPPLVAWVLLANL